MAQDIRVEKRSEEELKNEGVFDWPIWEKDVSDFEHYYDEQEICYFLEGEVRVETEDGDVHVEQGDYVVFPQGLSCTWHISKPVRKHYKFG